MTRLEVLLFVPLLGGALAGCAALGSTAPPAEHANPLVGTWAGEDSTRFVFNSDGSALWVFESATPPDTFRLRYAFDATPDLDALDLAGFDRGFLAGRTLYCIVGFDSAEAFRMDCEPGVAGSRGAARPTAFTTQTKSYRAVR